MVSKMLFLSAIVVLASCSAPKYTYYFDHHNYNSVKNKPVGPNEGSSKLTNDQILNADISSEPTPSIVSNEKSYSTVTKTYMQMNKSERTALRHHLKREFKSFLPSKKNDGSHEAMSTGWDSDLKLATIFGAVGVTGMIIGGSVFNVIGWISFVIGLVFFVKWVIRQ